MFSYACNIMSHIYINLLVGLWIDLDLWIDESVDNAC